jgi:hypothetical protein
MSFCNANWQALGEPGKQKTIFPFATPANARLIIAALPISS